MNPATTSLRVVLLGPPASGKGTQGRALAAGLELQYLSTGALLREEIRKDTDLGRQAEPLLARGTYIPDELMNPPVAEWLSSREGGWVLDGFPRTLPQAKFIDAWLCEHAMPLTAAVSLEVPFEELLERVAGRMECPACGWTGSRSLLAPGHTCPKCGAIPHRRADDGEENFRRRYREFVETTTPVLEHYRSLGILQTCSATAAPAAVTDSLITMLQQGAPLRSS